MGPWALRGPVRERTLGPEAQGVRERTPDPRALRAQGVPERNSTGSAEGLGSRPLSRPSPPLALGYGLGLGLGAKGVEGRSARTYLRLGDEGRLLSRGVYPFVPDRGPNRGPNRALR